MPTLQLGFPPLILKKNATARSYNSKWLKAYGQVTSSIYSIYYMAASESISDASHAEAQQNGFWTWILPDLLSKGLRDPPKLKALQTFSWEKQRWFCYNAKHRTSKKVPAWFWDEMNTFKRKTRNSAPSCQVVAQLDTLVSAPEQGCSCCRERQATECSRKSVLF